MTVPARAASRATIPPTISDVRAPYTVRLYRSRPKLSVPKRCSALGGASRISGRTRSGLWVASVWARSATARIAKRSPPPITNRRLRSAVTYQGRSRRPRSFPSPIESCAGHGLASSLALLPAITVTFAGPPGPTLGRLAPRRCRLALTPGRSAQKRTSVPGTGSPAGAASRVGPGDLDLCGQRTRHRICVRVYQAYRSPQRSICPAIGQLGDRAIQGLASQRQIA